MIELKSPSVNLVASYLEFVDEMHNVGEKIWESFLPRADESHEKFANRLLTAEFSPPPGLVPESIYWATRGDQVVGRISLRHVLNDNLKEFGGNIGYEVRPSTRRMGIATEILRLLLETPKTKSSDKTS